MLVRKKILEIRVCHNRSRGCNELPGHRNDMGMGHSFTVPVNWHFHPQSRSFVDPGDIKNSPRHSIDRGSLSLVAFVQSGCIVALSTCLLLSLLFSPLLLLSWRSASGPRTVHQNASDLTKLDARLVFVQFRSPIVRFALE